MINFSTLPGSKDDVMGRHIWLCGYYVNTVGQYRTEEVIKGCVENQGRENEYEKVYSKQLSLF